MQINFLKEVVEDIAGKPATEIVNLLIDKKDVNEFLIAKKLKLTINQTRNILYKLSEVGLVSSTRKKDKRKGWFIYFWTLDIIKSLELLEKKLSGESNQLKHQLTNRKSKRFYICKTCNVETREETALLNQFTCHECGQVYELSESTKIIKELENRITKLDKQLAIIAEERGKLQVKEQKRIDRKAARDEAKKKKERKLKRAAKKAAKEKEDRKLGKKIVKKKIKKKVKKKASKKVTKKIKKPKKKAKKK